MFVHNFKFNSQMYTGYIENCGEAFSVFKQGEDECGETKPLVQVPNILRFDGHGKVVGLEEMVELACLAINGIAEAEQRKYTTRQSASIAAYKEVYSD